MKVVLLAGGLGTRLAEETGSRPKPLVEIGGMPIIWHIMKIYAAYGLNEFIICAGYKGHMIKEYFANYALRTSNITVNLHSGHVELECVKPEPWTVKIIDTGEGTLTGGRIKRILPASPISTSISCCSITGRKGGPRPSRVRSRRAGLAS